MQTIWGMTTGFSVILQRYLLLGTLFCIPGVLLVGGVCGHFGVVTPSDPFLARLAACVFGGLFIAVGCAIALGGIWWLRAATRVLAHVTPVTMLMHGRSRSTVEQEPHGDAYTTAYAKLTPIDPASGIRSFKRVPLEWPTWRLRWPGVRDTRVQVYYDVAHGGPLVIETEDGRLLLSQLLWDRGRRRSKRLTG